MQLSLMTWQEVETYLEDKSAIILPIGSQEQHGPMGLIGTDAQTAEAVARRIGEQEGIIVGPTISVGMAQHHLGFAGSMTLRPTTLIALIVDYVTSLARHGFDHFYFINGHGGNITTVQTAFQEIYADYSLAAQASPLRCRLANWFAMKDVVALTEELYGDREGMHATPSEVAMTQYLFPDAIKSMEPAEAAPVKRMFTDSADYRDLFPDGRMGAASELANPEDGKHFLEIAATAVTADLRAFLAGNK